MKRIRVTALLFLFFECICGIANGQELVGVSSTPHTRSPIMRWRRQTTSELAARVELFLLNNTQDSIRIEKSNPPLFDETSPNELVESLEWAWHDSPEIWEEGPVDISPGCLMVLPFNGRSAAWGPGTTHSLQLDRDQPKLNFRIDDPLVWLSAVTFLAVNDSGRITDDPFPNQIVIHVKNKSHHRLEFQAVRLWLPKPDQTRVYYKAMEFIQLDCFPQHGAVASSSHGGAIVRGDTLPRCHAVVEVQMKQDDGENIRLWAYQKIKPEHFDISGGWIATDIRGRNSLTIEEYLQTLKRMHINTGQIEEVSGYSDEPLLVQKYPFKRFNRMQDLARYDRDEMLPSIHAVEFIGEPQYGGGKPIPPQEVFELLAPYHDSRLPTSLTLSEERTWRYYAGLSDYPHYDAYRVIAPAADSWSRYDRWGGVRIRWGAPLETIGVMTRSLKRMSRPRPIAYWSQGAHHGWGGRWSTRRGSPTPDELRSQAWHGLANHVTSLYWFNLSLSSLVKFPDLIQPITRVNREIRMLDDLLLTGDLFEHRTVNDGDGTQWEINVIATPAAALIVVHDTAYQPDHEENVFEFEKRLGEWSVALPSWIERDPTAFAVDADGTHEMDFSMEGNVVSFSSEVEVVGMFVVANDPDLRTTIDARHDELIRLEREIPFDPVGRQEDLRRLKSFLSEPDE